MIDEYTSAWKEDLGGTKNKKRPNINLNTLLNIQGTGNPQRSKCLPVNIKTHPAFQEGEGSWQDTNTEIHPMEIEPRCILKGTGLRVGNTEWWR